MLSEFGKLLGHELEEVLIPLDIVITLVVLTRNVAVKEGNFFFAIVYQEPLSFIFNMLKIIRYLRCPVVGSEGFPV